MRLFTRDSSSFAVLRWKELPIGQQLPPSIFADTGTYFWAQKDYVKLETTTTTLLLPPCAVPRGLF